VAVDTPHVGAGAAAVSHDPAAAPTQARPRWRSFFPSLHGYERTWLTGDLLASLTVWAVLVPEALAYASIAGVSPVVVCTRRRAPSCCMPCSATRAI
jgi:hypothetical protein